MPEPTLPLSDGCVAQIVRLPGPGRTHLRGKLVKVRCFEASSSCWTATMLDNPIEQIECKAECLMTQLGKGCAVELTSVEGREELKGTIAKLGSYDDAAGAWVVEIPGQKELIRCKRDNLTLKATLALDKGCTALIIGLKSRADLNGKVVKVLEYEGSVSRWVVQLPDSHEQIRCKPECLIAQFAVGLTVELTGLQSRADLNGKLAILKAYDEEAGRWGVELVDSKEPLRCKPQCMKGPLEKAAEEKKQREAAEQQAKRLEAEEAQRRAAELRAKQAAEVAAAAEAKKKEVAANDKKRAASKSSAPPPKAAKAVPKKKR